MDSETFRREAHRLADWIAGYLERSETYPVLSQVKPGAIRAGLPAEPPRDPEPFDRILADFESVL
ncbi:MAG: aspartate aminotransferase family protein, partial [Candidatus Eremiobacterota bacterium]